MYVRTYVRGCVCVCMCVCMCILFCFVVVVGGGGGMLAGVRFKMVGALKCFKLSFLGVLVRRTQARNGVQGCQHAGSSLNPSRKPEGLPWIAPSEIHPNPNNPKPTTC